MTLPFVLNSVQQALVVAGAHSDVIDHISPGQAELNFAIAATRVDKKMTALISRMPKSVASYATQKCINNGSSFGGSFDRVEITSSDFEMFAKICRADIIDLVCTNVAGVSTREFRANPGNFPAALAYFNELYTEIILGYAKRFGEEATYSKMFGDVQFTYQGGTTQGRRNALVQNADPAKTNFVEKVIKKQDGLWFSLLDMAFGTQPNRPKLVNTNDGTAAGNKLNPSNVLGLLDEIISSMTMEMQMTPSQVINLLDPHIMSAANMAAILKLAGTEGIVKRFEDFNLMVTPFTYRGFTWLPFTASYTYGGKEIDSIITSVIPNMGRVMHERNCRTLSILKGNAATLTSEAIEQKLGPNFMTVSRSMENREIGVDILQGVANWGVGAIDPQHVVIGASTSDIYTN